MSSDPPWWSADDEQFSGATPLFEGGADADATDGAEAAEGAGTGSDESGADATADAGSSTTSTPPSGSAGTPVMEALRLAAAVAAWSNETGLTDTLRELAGEAAEQLSASTAAGELPLADATPTATHEATCDYCPLCRSVAILRVVQPQMAQGVAEAMAGLTEALEAAVEGFAASNRPR